MESLSATPFTTSASALHKKEEKNRGREGKRKLQFIVYDVIIKILSERRHGKATEIIGRKSPIPNIMAYSWGFPLFPVFLTKISSEGNVSFFNLGILQKRKDFKSSWNFERENNDVIEMQRTDFRFPSDAGEFNKG